MPCPANSFFGAPLRLLPRAGAALCTAALLFAAAPDASAVTITTNYVSSGTYGGLTFGSASSSTAGGGTLDAIMNQAVSYWEAALPDAGNLTVNYGWSDLGSGTLGETSTSSLRNHPPSTAYMAFTNVSSIAWFFDATPGSNSEYGTFKATSADLGGGTINTGRVFTGATGDAVNRFDMLTVIEHELGHALGFSGAPNPLDIANPLPYAGTALPTDHASGGDCTSNCDHINISSAIMYPSIPRSERKLLTDADILGVAQLRGDKNVNLTPVPLPAAGPLMLSGLVGLLGWGGRRRRAA